MRNFFLAKQDAGRELLEGRGGESAEGPAERELESNVGRMADGLSFGLDLNPWIQEPDIPRVAQGVPNRVHRLKALGNAVVPQIPYLLSHAILKLQGGD